MKTAALAAVFAFMLISYALVSTQDHDDAVQTRSLYCDMVAEWHKTGGEYGWPPYEGECK